MNAVAAGRTVPEACTGSLPESLLRIREPDVRLAVWRRRLPEALSAWVAAHVRGGAGAGGRCETRACDIRVNLDPMQPLAPALDAVLDRALSLEARASATAQQWRRDMLDLIGWAQRIAPQSPILKLRVQRLEDAGCPLFHVDRVPLRMLCAYAGAGTEWLPEHALDRARLGTGSNASVRDWSAVRALAAGEVAVMKGEAYPGNAGRGLVHRSPEASPAQPRVIVAVDFG